MSEFQTILCPVDLSELSQTAYPVALSLAGKYGSTLLLVHVVDDTFPYPDAFAWSNPGEDFYQAMGKEAREELRKLVEEHPPGDVKVERKILQGKPYEEILALAKDKKAGLIVLSTHSRTGLDHVLMGSQAEKILRRARCPVLVVKPETE